MRSLCVYVHSTFHLIYIKIHKIQSCYNLEFILNTKECKCTLCGINYQSSTEISFILRSLNQKYCISCIENKLSLSQKQYIVFSDSSALNYLSLLPQNQFGSNLMESTHPKFKLLSWILDNTKQCPECSIDIEKNKASNNITCRKHVGGCGAMVCWLCGKEWHHNSHSNCFSSFLPPKHQKFLMFIIKY